MNNRQAKRVAYVLVAAGIIAYNYFTGGVNHGVSPDRGSSSVQQPDATNTEVHRAFEQRRSDVQVRGSGTVIKVLPDDTKGSRHQKFLLSLGNGLTVLVAHNIDLARRLAGLSEGDSVEFYGEYEYTEKGGVIHWTHHDPANRHVGGWLKHRGVTYQ